MLSFVPDIYPGGLVYARYDGQDIAHYHAATGRTMIRWYHFEHGEPGWLTNAPSVAAAET